MQLARFFGPMQEEVSAAAHDNHADTAASVVGFAAGDCSVDHDNARVVVVHLKTTLRCIYFATSAAVVTIFPETTDFLLCFIESPLCLYILHTLFFTTNNSNNHKAPLTDITPLPSRIAATTLHRAFSKKSVHINITTKNFLKEKHYPTPYQSAHNQPKRNRIGWL